METGRRAGIFASSRSVAQANLLAATTTNPAAANQAYNVALGHATTLNELFQLLQTALRKLDGTLPEQKPSTRISVPATCVIRWRT